MNEREIREMQRRIDEGIRLAQQRLWERAGREGRSLVVEGRSLVVMQDGKLREIIPEAKSDIAPSPISSDPLQAHTAR